MELNRMMSNPVAANRFIQNAGNLIGEIITPIKFNPDTNESYFDWLNENSKDDNKLWKATKKVVPILGQIDKEYSQMYGLLER